MDIHARIAAILHIVLNLISFCLLCFIAVPMSGILHSDVHTMFSDAASAIMMVVLMAAALLSIVSIFASIAFLRGSSVARIVLIVLGIMDLFAFPVGTVLGIYTLWALLRRHPRSQAYFPIRRA